MLKCQRQRNKISLMLSVPISLLFMIGFALPSVLAITGKTPDVSSTILKMHQLYLKQPPHDTSLYETLQVSPNATTARISQSYRRLSRKYHPDKQVKESSASKEDAAANLQQVRQAYEILKDDSTRLPYHQYGFTDPKVALLLLIGPASQQSQLDLQERQASLYSLLELTGLDFPSSSLPLSSPSSSAVEQRKKMHQWRVQTMASRLVEQLRPWVEETVEPGILAHVISHACDEWKVLPLGAQIVRCVGRAYRHAGQDYLQKQRKRKRNLPRGQLEAYLFGSFGVKGSRSKKEKLPVSKIPVSVRKQWRKTKGFWSAAWATGRASFTEQLWTLQEKKRQKKRGSNKDVPSLEYTSLGDGADFLDPDFFQSSENDDEAQVALEEEQEMKEAQRLKSQQTLLQSLQVEALWKVTKIDLDRAVQEACNLILEGHHSFAPSLYQGPSSSSPFFGHDDSPSPDGWISPSSGKAINTEEARIRAAHAMRYIGNIMVQRSKEGTSWKE